MLMKMQLFLAAAMVAALVTPASAALVVQFDYIYNDILDHSNVHNQLVDQCITAGQCHADRGGRDRAALVTEAKNVGNGRSISRISNCPGRMAPTEPIHLA